MRDTDLLAELIKTRHELLAELHQLARRQVQLIGEGDMGRLFSLLAVKQGRLNELVRVDRQLDPYRTEDPDRRLWRSNVDRLNCREMASRCQQLLGEITRMEKECEAALVQQRDQAATFLQGMDVASQATRAYHAAVSVSGSQFDASCDT